jgi:hypothetical protein
MGDGEGEGVGDGGMVGTSVGADVARVVAVERTTLLNGVFGTDTMSGEVGAIDDSGGIVVACCSGTAVARPMAKPSTPTMISNASATTMAGSPDRGRLDCPDGVCIHLPPVRIRSLFIINKQTACPHINDAPGKYTGAVGELFIFVGLLGHRESVAVSGSWVLPLGRSNWKLWVYGGFSPSS